MAIYTVVLVKPDSLAISRSEIKKKKNTQCSLALFSELEWQRAGNKEEGQVR